MIAESTNLYNSQNAIFTFRVNYCHIAHKVTVKVNYLEQEQFTVTLCDSIDDKYRFGFNGMEKDNELKGIGNSLDFGARMYDSRLGRWLSLDPLADQMPWSSHYSFSSNSPLWKLDPDGKWDVEVHVYKDREKYGYGIAIVKDREGNEVFRFDIRAEGIGGVDRMKNKANTPLGVYDIPDKAPWISGGNRKAYGKYHRLALDGKSGEIKESGRTEIRIHGGRQETYNEVTKTWDNIINPKLKKTHGCMRAFDKDMKQMKTITDGLEKNNSKEFGGELTVVDDLVEQDGDYIIPESKSKNDKVVPNSIEFKGFESIITPVDNTYVIPRVDIKN